MSQALAPRFDIRAEGLAAIRGTLAEIQTGRLAWERDVVALFDDFDSLAVKMAMDSTARASQPDRKEECLLELAGQQETLAKQQASTASELSAMREMIEQQTELLVATARASQPDGKGKEECLLELAGQQEALAKQQASTASELSAMREMIEQQTELLAATARTSQPDRKEESLLELAGQQETLAKQQESTAIQLSAMREMIEQQTELLVAFVGAATQLTEPGKPVKTQGRADPVVSAVQAQFAQLSKVPTQETGNAASRPSFVAASIRNTGT
jgi:hypothetical protein